MSCQRQWGGTYGKAMQGLWGNPLMSLIYLLLVVILIIILVKAL